MTARLTVRLTPSEKAALEHEAVRAKTTLSRLVRERLTADFAATTFAREMTDSVVRVVSTEAEKSTAAAEQVRAEIAQLRADLREQLQSIIRQVWAAAKKGQREEA